jgi:hypothetical protein
MVQLSTHILRFQVVSLYKFKQVVERKNIIPPSNINLGDFSKNVKCSLSIPPLEQILRHFVDLFTSIINQD